MAFAHAPRPKKVEKSSVGYEHPARGRERCEGCKHFEVDTPNTCETVKGVILPKDWCVEYKPE